jgi:hypothetical protein
MLGNPNDIIQHISYIPKSCRAIEEVREVVMKIVEQGDRIGVRHGKSW